MRKLKLLAFFIFFPIWIQAIEYSPWFQRVLYFEGRVLTEYQWGDHYNLTHDEIALRVSPWTDIRAEVELDLFASRRFSFNAEALKVAGQYRFFNDIIGDPLSLTAGVTLIVPTTRARREYALFYPGNIEAEFHVVAGKERSCYESWLDRGWIDLAYGIADRHSPWFMFHGQWDRNLDWAGECSLFLKTLSGSIKRSVEFGGIYSYTVAQGVLKLTLMRRPIAHNLPTTTSLTLEYTTPLSF